MAQVKYLITKIVTGTDGQVVISEVDLAEVLPELIAPEIEKARLQLANVLNQGKPDDMASMLLLWSDRKK